MQAFFSHRYFILSVLALLSVVSIGDLIADHHEGVGFQHMAEEGIVLVLCLIGLGNLLLGMRAQTRRIARLKNELQETEQQVVQANAFMRDGRFAFGKVIAEQFAEWSLSKSEQEVGLLLLKGFSLSEIASLRDTKEKTVRQQASSIYKKSGVSGRHAFSAWFIEDYM